MLHEDQDNLSNCNEISIDKIWMFIERQDTLKEEKVEGINYRKRNLATFVTFPSFKNLFSDLYFNYI